MWFLVVFGGVVPSVEFEDLPSCFCKVEVRENSRFHYCSKRWTCRFTCCNFKNPHHILVNCSFDVWGGVR